MKPHLGFLACLAIACWFPCSAEPATDTAEKAYKKEIVVTPLLKTQTDGAGKPLAYPAGTPEITAVHVEIPPGKQTGWHTHPMPCFAYVLEGELSVETKGDETKILKAGQAFAEVVNVLHNGTNTGVIPAKLIMFVTGEAGHPYAVKPDASK